MYFYLLFIPGLIFIATFLCGIRIYRIFYFENRSSDVFFKMLVYIFLLMFLSALLIEVCP